MMKGKQFIFGCVFSVCLLSGVVGCSGKILGERDFCFVVLEEGEGFSVGESVLSVERGADVVFEIVMDEGYELGDVKYGDGGEEEYALTYGSGGRDVTLTLRGVRYSETVRVEVQKSDVVIRYDGNGGSVCDEGSGKRKSDREYVGEDEVLVAAAGEHLRVNTEIGTDLFERDGYTLIGWNTEWDGSGDAVGLGSRVDWEEGMVLYAQWIPWTGEEVFVYEVEGEFAKITGFDGEGAWDCICVPGELEGKKVRRIGSEAFQGVDCETVVLPAGIYEVENGAFEGAALRELYLYDDISRISDLAFGGCGEFETVHINAIEEPVYSGNYFDTFQDKYDRLLQLKDEKKIVLFSGSSTRFGYDSAMIDEAFADYEVVNMGVFAYTPALPQMRLILDCMREGDILLHAPEFDASNRQFCAQRDLDYATFAMMESDYDLFSKLDIREYGQVFTAFTAYNNGREGMEKKNYGMSASHYDEDGIPVEESSYNEYGDYCLYRPNSEEEQPIYGLPARYTVNAFPKEQYIEPLNAVYEQFLEKGVKVYFTYAPRNQYALSEDSTVEERARLHQYFQENLAVPVISELEDSLVSGVYLYGTDNHLSTEGVEIRTRRIIGELRKQLEESEKEQRLE